MRSTGKAAVAFQQTAWTYGRSLFDDLLGRYAAFYDLTELPAPAPIIGELLTQFLGVGYYIDPLPDDRFAQTHTEDGRVIITVNSLTGLIPGVKDVRGVQNVAAFHEGIHVVRNRDLLTPLEHDRLPGLAAPVMICYRSGPSRDKRYSTVEHFAEEAGRAAAIPVWALERSRPYQEFVRRGAERSDGHVPDGWKYLYPVSEELGVNITALVKQLQFENRLVIDPERQLFVPWRLF